MIFNTQFPMHITCTLTYCIAMMCFTNEAGNTLQSLGHVLMPFLMFNGYTCKEIVRYFILFLLFYTFVQLKFCCYELSK